MYEYNIDRINKAISAKNKTMRTCRDVARMYSPVELPNSVIQKIHSRRKLYNFLEALDHKHTWIKAIFHQYGLSVPNDTTLKPSAEPKEEPRPDWLVNLNKEEEIEECFF